jgi:hypothetical protein
MNFTWLNKQGVRSDTGFEFQFTGRYLAEYRESGRVIVLSIETAGGVATIYEDQLLGPLLSAREPLVAQRREQLIANVRAALQFQGLELELLPGAPS